MVFHLYHPTFLEKWDVRTLDSSGIGGSETCQVEIGWRLARRGHEVHSYALLPDDAPAFDRGVHWHKLEDVDHSAPGIWIIFRSPLVLDKFEVDHPHQELWMMCQDVDYVTNWFPEQSAKMDTVLALCPVHAIKLIENHPEISSKVKLWSNGVRSELIREVRDEKIERDPFKFMYASSPDRGLLSLLKIFPRIREIHPEAHLHVFYGTNNIEKIIEIGHPMANRYKKLLKDINQALESQPNVTYHGRVSQRELIRHWFSTNIWCHPTDFQETSCITCMEAQVCGAIPITNPIWALGSNVKGGVFITGSPANSALVRARYVGSAVYLLDHPEICERVRKHNILATSMMFGWDLCVDSLDAMAEKIDPSRFMRQFNFQVRHAEGRVLNVGCHSDIARFGENGVNVDIQSDLPNVHIVCDAREGIPTTEVFDSAVLGDILEHMSDEDAVKVLVNTAKHVKPGGKIVITVPDDNRDLSDQCFEGDNYPEYGEGLCKFHNRRITLETVDGWLSKAGLTRVHHQEFEYGPMAGNGVVAVC